MTQQSDPELIKIIGDSNLPLQDRIKAVLKAGDSGDVSLIIELKKISNRPMPLPLNVKNWDPVAVERIVDLYIIAALHKLGDNSEIDRIAILVRQAGDRLQEPETEMKSASKVIRSIGRKEPVREIVDLTIQDDQNAVRNAVGVLNQLNFPNAPIGGNTSSVLPSDKYTFQFTRLRQEMEMLVNLSKGKIQLSDGVAEFIKTKDFDRGSVKLENRTLSERVERDLDMLDFNYYVEKNHVVICTHQEAGKRWREWWKKYHDTVKFK